MGAERHSPLPIRLWHGAQALLMLGLIASGLSMHYADSGWMPIPFRTAVYTHNVCGVLSALLWIFFVGYNALSGNGRHYIPVDWRVGRLLAGQLRYYAFGMFRGEPPPYPAGFKTNPLQRLVYAGVMYGLMPLSIVSGSLLLFPMLAPQRALGSAGLWPMALLHLSAGYLLTLFLVTHIYLASTGETVSALYREIFSAARTPGPRSARGSPP